MKGLVKQRLESFGLFEVLTPDQFYPTVTSATKAYRALTGAEWTPVE